MAQEQQPAQDVLPMDKAAHAGTAPDAMDNILKQVNDIRSAQAYDASSLNEVLVSGSAAAAQALKALGLDKLFIGGADAADAPSAKAAGKSITDSNPAEGHSGQTEGFSGKKGEKGGVKSSQSDDSIKASAIADGIAIGGKFRDSAENTERETGKLKIAFERPLSRIEQMITKELLKSARSGDLEGVKEMLATLNESPKSVDAVLRQVRESLSSSGSRANLGWERGTDDSGNSFVRMHLTEHDKATGQTTRVTVGSDGTENAYSQSWKQGSHKNSLDASTTLENMLRAPEQPELRQFGPVWKGGHVPPGLRQNERGPQIQTEISIEKPMGK